MPFKFEGLEAWKLTLDYVDLLYAIAKKLPKSEQYNLNSQMRRAVVSIGLNLAEGSTGQTDAQQVRYVTMSIGSLQETVACLQIVKRLHLLEDEAPLKQAYRQAEVIASKLHNLRKSLSPEPSAVREEEARYLEQQHALGYVAYPQPSTEVGEWLGEQIWEEN